MPFCHLNKSKWAAGSIIRANTIRELTKIGNHDLIVGIIMVRRPNLEPKEWRRRRAFDGNVLNDLVSRFIHKSVPPSL